MKPASSPSQGSFISGLFGLRALPPMHGKPESPDEIVTPLDILRKQAIEGYEATKKYIDENSEQILEEDKKREQTALAEQRTSLVGFLERITKGSPPEQGQQGKN